MMNILFFLTPKAELQFLEADYTVRQAIEKIRVKGYTAIPIISKKDGQYCGTASEGDILWYLINKNKWSLYDLEDEKVINIIDHDKYKPVKINAQLDDLLQLIQHQNFVPVVDDRGVFMGIITRRKVIEYYYNKEKDSRKQNA